MGRRLAIAFVVLMAAAVIWALYDVVLPGIRGRAADDVRQNGMVVQGPGSAQSALMGACEKASLRLSASFGNVPRIIFPEGRGMLLNYVDTSRSAAWSYMCENVDGAVRLTQIDAARSATNPHGWVRNADGSMTMLDADSHPLTVQGRTMSFDGGRPR